MIHVYLVAHTAEAGEVHEILSAWTSRDDADLEAARMQAEASYDSRYHVEVVELNRPWTKES